MGMEALDSSLYWVLSRIVFTYIYFLQSFVLEVLELSYLPLGHASVAQKDEQLVTVMQAAVTGQVFSLQRLMLLSKHIAPHPASHSLAIHHSIGFSIPHKTHSIEEAPSFLPSVEYIYICFSRITGKYLPQFFKWS